MILKVPLQKNPIRLDKFLIGRFPKTSRTFWRKNLSIWIEVDGKKAKKGQFLKGGEVLALKETPPESLTPLAPNPKLKLTILFEDSYLFAVDKPAGLPCLPLTQDETETVVQGVLAHFPKQAKVDPETWETGLIHRLDNNTSGVLLFGKTPEAKKRLLEINRKGKIRKEYLAWVEGIVSGEHVIDSAIAHHRKNPRKMVAVYSEKEKEKLKARDALTHFKVLKTNDGYSLLLIEIHRGARHQIRVHLASLGHSVVGDSLYGAGQSANLKRHLLHASGVIFHHPFTKKLIKIDCPPPPDFKLSKSTYSKEI